MASFFQSSTSCLHAMPLAASLVTFTGRHPTRRATRSIAGSFHASTSSPPRHLLHRLFLSLRHVLPAVPLAASLVAFTGRHPTRLAARSIAGSFHASTSCPPRHLLHRLFLSLRHVLPAVPLAASLVAFTGRHPIGRAARSIAGTFHASTSCPPRHWLYRLFLSLVILPVPPLAASLVPFTRRRPTSRATCCIACSFLASTSCPPRHSLHRLFLALVDILPVPPRAALLVSFTSRRLAHPTVCRIPRFFRLTVRLLAAPPAVSLVSFPC
jgi:hypothetical protein